MHRMTSRVLVCPEVCRDERYLDVSISFMNSVMITGLTAISLPLGPLRGILTRLLVAAIHKPKLEAALAIVQPIVEARLRELDRGAEAEPQHQDAIQWAIELAQELDDPTSPSTADRPDARHIALNTLQNIWAGSAGPAVGVTQMLFQVLLMPEYLAPLREEAARAIERYGWTDKAMNHVPLLDSFIRECNRCYPLGSVTAARTIMREEGFRFHDGLTFPQGTRVAFATAAMQRDERFVKDADKFDGFRFVTQSGDGEDDGDSGPGPGEREDGSKGNNPKRHLMAASTVTPTNLV